VLEAASAADAHCLAYYGRPELFYGSPNALVFTSSKLLLLAPIVVRIAVTLTLDLNF
jgi:hypothetical protein